MNLQEITERMSKLKDWSLEGNSISKNFEFYDFKTALEFANKVGEISERNAHHPDILISKRGVRLVISTHSLGELSLKDFDLAEKIDEI